MVVIDFFLLSYAYLFSVLIFKKVNSLSSDKMYLEEENDDGKVESKNDDEDDDDVFLEMSQK